MSRNIIVTMMIGMDRFSERDADHPFDMGHMEGYNILWLPQVDPEEKRASTLFYEVSKAVDEARSEYTKIKDNVVFIMGRGTIGDKSEESLQEALLETNRTYGPDALRIMVGKSYGVVDTLRALRNLKEWNVTPLVDLMILIDGFAPKPALRDITKRFGWGDRRFIRPQNARMLVTAVQKTSGFHGLIAGPDNDVKCSNYVVNQDWVDQNSKYYNHYSDGYQRRLDVCHKYMEEIVSVVPCLILGGEKMTLSQAVKSVAKKAWS